MPKLKTRIHTEIPIPPIESLERYFREGGSSIIQAAFAHSYFIDPNRVREQTPYYPERARYSRKHYPGKKKGDSVVWQGDNREVTLDDNNYAQQAFTQYTGCPMQRGSGYGVRHIWGEPWNPDAFTAGWNLCYMPFWAGMLTEKQHPHKELQTAICQASWDIYFRQNSVCSPPDFVKDPGMDLADVLNGQPILILCLENSERRTHRTPNRTQPTQNDIEQIQPLIREILGVLLNILPEEEVNNLMSNDYCKNTVGLKIGGFPLIKTEREPTIRYWRDQIAGYYVCSQWWREHHIHNARAFRDYLKNMRQDSPHKQRLDLLISQLEEYLTRNT